MNLAVKLREEFDIPTLLAVALATTMFAIFPSLSWVWSRPTHGNLLLALLTTSLGWFIFSFQV